MRSPSPKRGVGSVKSVPSPKGGRVRVRAQHPFHNIFSNAQMIGELILPQTSARSRHLPTPLCVRPASLLTALRCQLIRQVSGDGPQVVLSNWGGNFQVFRKSTVIPPQVGVKRILLRLTKKTFYAGGGVVSDNAIAHLPTFYTFSHSYNPPRYLMAKQGTRS